MNFDILIRCAIAMVCGWIIGFLMTRSALKEKYKCQNLTPEGTLKLAYDRDNPSQPPMGLEIESLGYILTHDTILLKIVKIGFPKTDDKIYLESKKDKSA